MYEYGKPPPTAPPPSTKYSACLYIFFVCILAKAAGRADVAKRVFIARYAARQGAPYIIRMGFWRSCRPCWRHPPRTGGRLIENPLWPVNSAPKEAVTCNNMHGPWSVTCARMAEWEVGRTVTRETLGQGRESGCPLQWFSANAHRSDPLSRDTATLILLHFVILFFPTTTVANSISLEPKSLDSK